MYHLAALTPLSRLLPLTSHKAKVLLFHASTTYTNRQIDIRLRSAYSPATQTVALLQKLPEEVLPASEFSSAGQPVVRLSVLVPNRQS